MRALILAALLWAVLVVEVTRCSAQDVADPQRVKILELWDQVQDTPPGLPTGGTKARDILDAVPAFTGPVVHAAVVPAPPRFGRIRSRRAGSRNGGVAPLVQQPVASGAEVTGVEPAAAATAAGTAADVASAPEWKVDVNLPRTAEADAAAAAAAVTTEAGPAITLQAAPSTYQAIFDRHDYFRAWHNTPGLTWSTTLATNAANYADRCQWGHDSSARDQGENLYAISGSGTNQATTLMNAINAWYDEYRFYSHNNPGFSEATGHFTQVVWKSTTAVGCAVKACGSGFAGWGNGGVYVVCRYSPAGNIVNAGYFQANVLQRSANPPSTTPPPPPAVIPPGTLPEGYMITTTSSGPGCLVAGNQLYWICLYSDANMVLFSNGKAVWSSRTSGISSNAPMKLVMMTSGSLNIYDRSDMLVWTTNTNGRGTAPRRFIMQNDGNAVIADANNRATWATYTKGL